MKQIYLVRHCQATGQESHAQLTDEGVRQSYQLAEFLRDKDIKYIVSSPYLRAIDTIKPLSGITDLKIHIDNRLQERILSAHPLQNWMKHLEETYKDYDLKFEGGESSNEAVRRGMEVIEEIIGRPEKTALIVTHGALLSLLINHYDNKFGYEDWKRLSNPDVFLLELDEDQATITRIWK